MFEEKGRAKKYVQNAARHLEPGESVREVVQTQIGQSARETGARVFTVSQGGALPVETTGPHLLLATDRNVYAMQLSGSTLMKVGEVSLKVPLAEADVKPDGKKKILFQGKTFNVMFTWGAHAGRFTSYVEASSKDMDTAGVGRSPG